MTAPTYYEPPDIGLIPFVRPCLVPIETLGQVPPGSVDESPYCTGLTRNIGEEFAFRCRCCPFCFGQLAFRQYPLDLIPKLKIEECLDCCSEWTYSVETGMYTFMGVSSRYEQLRVAVRIARRRGAR